MAIERGTMACVARALAAALLLAVVGSCDSTSEQPIVTTPPPTVTTSAPAVAPGSTVSIRTADGLVTLKVEVADDEEERATGLMHRTELTPVDGMAFLWEDPVQASFWMKDTLIPLSIAFWDETGRIVAILDMEPCRGDPCPTYDPGAAFVGALEVDRGRFDAEGVGVGDLVEVQEATP
jgi:uncharacterized membrane protein (UPF0127 family)